MIYIRRWAEMSPCGRFRFVLGRQWSADPTAPWMHFTMLNPSTANGEDDDPTIIRDVGYAMREDCGGLLVTNLSSYMATDPKNLLAWVNQCERAGKLQDRWGISTDDYIRDCAAQAKWNIVAWGANAGHKLLRRRAKNVLELLRIFKGWDSHPSGAYALAMTKAGIPSHPLMLPGSLRPRPLEVFQ